MFQPLSPSIYNNRASMFPPNQAMFKILSIEKKIRSMEAEARFELGFTPTQTLTKVQQDQVKKIMQEKQGDKFIEVYNKLKDSLNDINSNNNPLTARIKRN